MYINDISLLGSCNLPKALQPGVQSRGDAEHQEMVGDQAQEPCSTEGVHDLLQKCVQTPRRESRLNIIQIQY